MTFEKYNNILSNFYKTYNNKSTVRILQNVLEHKAAKEYQDKKGKPILDMTADELREMIEAILFSMNPGDIAFNQTKTIQVISPIHALFKYYIISINNTFDPFISKVLQAKCITDEMNKRRTFLSMEKMQHVFAQIESEDGYDRREYCELTALLFYCGCSEADEILSIKKSMIDHDNMTVEFGYKTIQLTPRCYELLMKFADKEFIDGRRRVPLLPYRDSVYKMTVKNKDTISIDDRSHEQQTIFLNRTINTYIGRYFPCEITGRKLYWLGIYDKLCNIFGKEKLNRIILTGGSRGEHMQIESAAMLSGAHSMGISRLKDNLYQYAV